MTHRERVGVRGRYVDTTSWTAPRFQRLTPDARLLLMVLRLAPSAWSDALNVIDLVVLERETGLTPGEIRHAFAELATGGYLVLTDPASLGPVAYRPKPAMVAIARDDRPSDAELGLEPGE